MQLPIADLNEIHVIESLAAEIMDEVATLNCKLKTIERKVKKEQSDRTTDARRRKLAGARVPMADYEAYKQCAQSAGLSMYRWTCNALEAAAEASLRR